MITGKRASNADLKAVFFVLLGLVLVFHIGLALRGREAFEDIRLGTALHYAQTKIDLADTIIVGFNATGTPTIQELPVWQMAAGLAFKLFGASWWGWATIVSLILFLNCLFPLFQIARMYLEDRCAWWALICFLAEPLVFFNSGMASGDGFCLSVEVWFLWVGAKLVREAGWKWFLPACALGALAAVSKLPFFMAAGLALLFLLLWQHGFCLKRLFFLAAVGTVSGALFFLWTHYTDSLLANAVFPLNDLRVSQGSTMVFWFFGDWHFLLSPVNWIKGGWRSLTGLLGDFTLVGLVVLALANGRGNPLARCLLAGAALTTLVFFHLVLWHWHYYLMFAPAVAMLCAEGFVILENRIFPDGPNPAMTSLASVLIGLSLLQGLAGMRALTYDPYPAQMADIIRQHTAPADKLVIVGGGWGGEEFIRSGRQGLSAWDTHIFDRPEDLAKLKSLGYNKLVMISQSPFVNAMELVAPGRAGAPRDFYPNHLTPQVGKWPTIVQTQDVLIKDIP